MTADTPPVIVQQIDADRPGFGSDPQIVPQFTLQAEMGTDGREIRLGLLPGLEADRDETDWGVKLRLTDTERLKASVKVTYGNAVGVEIPANIGVSKWFNLGLDVQWKQSTPLAYAAEFNITPTSRLTITPTLYRDDKARAAIFAAWVPPAHDNIQLDVGYAQGKVTIGIATAINFSDAFKRKDTKL